MGCDGAPPYLPQKLDTRGETVEGDGEEDGEGARQDVDGVLAHSKSVRETPLGAAVCGERTSFTRACHGAWASSPSRPRPACFPSSPRLPFAEIVL